MYIFNAFLMLSMQKYDNRSQVVTEREKKYWEQLSVACMTEESDDPDNPAQLVVHKLPWRSQSKYSGVCYVHRRLVPRVT